MQSGRSRTWPIQARTRARAAACVAWPRPRAVSPAAAVFKRLTPRVIHLVGPLLILLVLAYGALLRLDAISAKFDSVTLPRWLHRLQLTRTGASVLRPARMRWAPAPAFPHRDGPPAHSRSDPDSYLHHARRMRTFYA